MRLPKQPPNTSKLIHSLLNEQPELLSRPSALVRDGVEKANAECWNWEDCSYRAHVYGLSAEHFWAVVKLSRKVGRVETPITTSRGRPFTYQRTDSIQRVLHSIDLSLGGQVGAAGRILDTESDKQRYILTSLREEAISTSQIEGALVTRVQAKEMLRSKRSPINKHEWMVLNNYDTMQFLKDNQDVDLTPEFLCAIQERITRNNLDDPKVSGRFRSTDERVNVWDDEEDELVHQPPDALLLPERIKAFCEYANGETHHLEQNVFIHPAIRAVVLHFWLAYDHPFVDGNGRTARAIFYWSMLRSGYWLAEYLSISSIINQQRRKYYLSFVNTEMDGDDLTYFVNYHMSILDKSIDAFITYVKKQRAKQQENLSIGLGDYNARQQAILIAAVGDPLARFTYTSHANSHGVTLPTARADLLDLEQRGLLRSNRKGRRFEFYPAPDIQHRLGHPLR